MSYQYLIHLVIQYKYALIVPIAFFEGHVISLVCGFLARAGRINPYIAGVCIIASNLLGDCVLYAVGYHKGERFLLRWGKYIGIDANKLQAARAIYHSHKAPILLASKLTSGFGLAMVVLTMAGVVRIRFGAYLFWNFIGECIWTAGLISIGYFLGSIYQSIGTTIFKIGLCVVVLAAIVLIVLYLQHIIKKKIIHET